MDGQTFTDIEEHGVERWLHELAEEVRTEQYCPSPVRRVMIGKPDGVSERPLGIPTIRDRVVQTAAKLILEPVFEADFDEARSVSTILRHMPEKFREKSPPLRAPSPAC